MTEAEKLKQMHAHFVADNQHWWVGIESELKRRQEQSDKTLRKAALFLAVGTAEALVTAAYWVYRLYVA